MNQKKNNSWLSLKKTDVVYKDVAVSTESSGNLQLEDVQVSSRSTEHVTNYFPTFISEKTFNGFKCYILSSEDVCGTSLASNDTVEVKDKEPMFVIVDSSCLSNPSSRELLIEEKNKRGALRKHFNKNVQPIDMPSTSRDFRNDFTTLKRSDSNDELQMIDINLQSENEIPVDENEIDEESIVMSYLRNKDTHFELEGMMLSTKKKSSLLEDVPKMETIKEGEQFCAFPIHTPKSDLSDENKNEDTEPE